MTSVLTKSRKRHLAAWAAWLGNKYLGPHLPHSVSYMDMWWRIDVIMLSRCYVAFGGHLEVSLHTCNTQANIYRVARK